MSTTQQWLAIAAIVSWTTLSAMFLGCASETYSSGPAETSAASAPAAPAAPNSAGESDFAGVWQGTTLAGCAAFRHLPSRCDAEQNVTITLLQGADGKFSGRYTCAYGNMDCYHENTTGKVVDVSTIGARMNIRVIMPDVTSCIFTGLNVNQSVNGGYTCYQGGALIEQGSWRARRSY